jgi:uncharacterized protein YdeI (YjbR/CyaY-like superfamily)
VVQRVAVRHPDGVAPSDGERVHPETVEQWRGWLQANADRGRGVWLVQWKKATGRPALAYEQQVEEALCVGWIDSTAGTLDDERSMMWFAPRKRGSGWARTNKARLERLERQGRLQPRGRAVVEAARQDGSWSLLDDVEALVVPEDLTAAFALHPGAQRQWEQFPPSVRRRHLWWLVQARRPETRARRVSEIAARAARGERAGQ